MKGSPCLWESSRFGMSGLNEDLDDDEDVESGGMESGFISVMVGVELKWLGG